MISYILAIITGILFLGADRFTKAVFKPLMFSEPKPFIKGIIDITVIPNRGGAWGVLSGKTFVLLGFTLVIMALLIVFLAKYAEKSKLMFWAVCLIISGGIGNMIDRISAGEVVDFLHFEFWPDFPVFNVADCAVCIGAGLLCLYFIIDSVKEIKEKKLKAEALRKNENGKN
ncbi:MAG: signal peptidase II [Clostridia bacterium]|nr:signal peptidase II [Clostridia bacterium]